MNRTGLILGFVAGVSLFSRPSDAQYTVDFQTNLISNVTSNWIGDYRVGYTNFADVLTIENSGILSNSGYTYLGYDFGSSNNSVLVTGAGSVLVSPGGGPVVGNFGAANSMMISNGGCVVGLRGVVGWFPSSSNNIVLVTGSGSVWSNSGGLSIGNTGYGNRAVVSDGGKLVEIGGSTTLGSIISSSNNSVLVSGTGSLWTNSGGVFVGNSGAGNSVVISNGAHLVSNLGGNYSVFIGNGSNSSGNSVLITDSNSLWSSSAGFIVGVTGNNNRMEINGGGRLDDTDGFIGGFNGGSTNAVLVTGAGSLWNNSRNLRLDTTANSLAISNGGAVVDASGFIAGSKGGSISNTARVVDGGTWRNNSLFVGDQGSASRLLVDGGSVSATNLLIGFHQRGGTSCDNLVELDTGEVVVTNGAQDGTCEVRWGKLILNGGTLQVDRFVMTNACAQFVRTGGTLIYGTAVLDLGRDDDGDGIPNGWEQSHGRDPLNAADANTDTDGDGQSDLAEFQAGTDPTNSASAFRIVDITPDGDDMVLTWTTVGGKKYAVQFVDGDYTNSFTEFEPIIIAPGTGESTFSVIDPGAATNAPGRFYRVRLVP